MNGDTLLVAIRPPVAAAAVVGRGTFKIAPTLKRFGLAALDAGCSRLILDMSRCVGMDSTFMGVAGGLALRYRRERNGEVALVRLSAKNRALLQTLGLDRSLRLEDGEGDLASFSEPLQPASLVGTDQVALTKTMLAAHQTLADISPENREKFKDVLAYLEEDARRQSGPSGSNE